MLRNSAASGLSVSTPDVKRLGLVAFTSRVSADEVMRVAAAIDYQLHEHVSPVWEVEVSLAAYPNNQVPDGVWPIMIGAPGEPKDIHTIRGTPIAFVVYSNAWKLAASHEAIELAIDPYGNATARGPAPDG